MKSFYYTAIQAELDGKSFKPVEGVYNMQSEEFEYCIKNDEAIKLFKQDLIEGNDMTGVITFEDGRVEIFNNMKDRCFESFIWKLEYDVFNYLRENNLLFKNKVITFR